MVHGTVMRNGKYHHHFVTKLMRQQLIYPSPGFSTLMKVSAGNSPRGLFVIEFQNAHEGFLRHFDRTYLSHTLLTFLLLLEELLLT